jgi:hypothetical protein
MATAAADPSGEAQLNGIIQQDKQKESVAVHSFDPNATPEQKAAAAGKGRNQIESASDNGPGGKGESGSCATEMKVKVKEARVQSCCVEEKTIACFNSKIK